MHKYTTYCDTYDDILKHFKDPSQFCIEPFIKNIEQYSLLLTGELDETTIICLKNNKEIYGCYCNLYKSKELVLPEFKLVDIFYTINKWHSLNLKIIPRQQLTRSSFNTFKEMYGTIMIKSQFQIIHNNLIAKDWVKVICH